MKTIFTILVTLIFLNSCKTVQDTCQRDPLFITNVMDASGASKKELYTRAKYFIYTSYVSPASVIKWDDAEYNRITISGSQDIDAYPESREFYGYLHYNLDLQFKDNKMYYKLSIHTLKWTKHNDVSMNCAKPPKNSSQKSWDNFRMKSKEVCQTYVLDPFLAHMKEPYIKDF